MSAIIWIMIISYVTTEQRNCRRENLVSCEFHRFYNPIFAGSLSTVTLKFLKISREQRGVHPKVGVFLLNSYRGFRRKKIALAHNNITLRPINSSILSECKKRKQNIVLTARATAVWTIILLVLEWSCHRAARGSMTCAHEYFSSVCSIFGNYLAVI